MARRPRLTPDQFADACLALRRAKFSPREIARSLDSSVRAVYYGIERARLREAPRGAAAPKAPTLVPLFPIDSYTPQSVCPHHGPIEPGSAFCCMVCHQSGRDNHPALHRDPRTDPRPEPKPAEAPEPRKTRRQRRRTAMEQAVPSAN